MEKVIINGIECNLDDVLTSIVDQHEEHGEEIALQCTLIDGENHTSNCTGACSLNMIADHIANALINIALIVKQKGGTKQIFADGLSAILSELDIEDVFGSDGHERH